MRVHDHNRESRGAFAVGKPAADHLPINIDLGALMSQVRAVLNRAAFDHAVLRSATWRQSVAGSHGNSREKALRITASFSARSTSPCMSASPLTNSSCGSTVPETARQKAL